MTWLFTQPEAFQRALRDLFGYYANQVYRPGETARSAALIPTYRVPKLLIQQLELALYPLCQENPRGALKLADTLWQDPYLEPRAIAAYLVGQVPLALSDEVLERIKGWCTPLLPLPLLDTVLTKATEKLRRTAPQLLYELAAQWLSSSESGSQLLGLKLLHPLVQDPAFENLPEIFNRIKVPIQNISPRHQTEALEIIRALAQRSPMETTYFLRQLLTLQASKEVLRLVRKSLPALPPALQERLRATLKEINNLPPN